MIKIFVLNFDLNKITRDEHSSQIFLISLVKPLISSIDGLLQKSNIFSFTLFVLVKNFSFKNKI